MVSYIKWDTFSNLSLLVYVCHWEEYLGDYYHSAIWEAAILWLKTNKTKQKNVSVATTLFHTRTSDIYVWYLSSPEEINRHSYSKIRWSPVKFDSYKFTLLAQQRRKLQSLTSLNSYISAACRLISVISHTLHASGAGLML